MPQPQKGSLRKISADDLYNLQAITSCEISPDGKFVVYSVQFVDKEKQKKFANLWLVPSDGGKPRRLTVGDQVDSQPHWSPSGDKVAFISNRKDEKQPQIYILPMAGGRCISNYQP